MLDKFMQLTRKILNILSIEYTIEIRGYTLVGEKSPYTIYDILYRSSNTTLETIIEIHDSSPDYNPYNISIVGFTYDVRNEQISNQPIVLDTNINLSKPYMNVINSIFGIKDGYGGDRDGDILYVDIYENDINVNIVDELLNYTDKELKLYINLL